MWEHFSIKILLDNIICFNTEQFLFAKFQHPEFCLKLVSFKTNSVLSGPDLDIEG